MTEDKKFGYSVLRYVYDVSTQEFINVGILLYSPQDLSLYFKASTEVRRLRALYPDFETTRAYKNLIWGVQSAFDAYAAGIKCNKCDSIPAQVMDAATKIIPHDTSALQWSEPGGGYTKDLKEKLYDLHQRFVVRKKATLPTRKSESAVMKPFKATLQNKGAWKALGPITLAGTLDKHEFKYSWKNGQYHCFQPTVFDQTTSTGIKTHVYELIGQVNDLEQCSNKPKIHFLTGEPQSKNLKREYREATTAMQKILAQRAEVIQEDEIPRFSEQMAVKILSHGA